MAGLPYDQQSWHSLGIPMAPRAVGQALQSIANLLPALVSSEGAPGHQVSVALLATQVQHMPGALSQRRIERAEG